MRMLPCSYAKCGERRIHWDQPYTPRGTQMVPVPDNYYGGTQYCSFECAIYDGFMTIRPENFPPFEEDATLS